MATEFIAGAVVSTFIESTIDNLASLFGDIFRGNKSKKKQLSNLKVKLLAIDVVVDDAEQKQFTNPRVRDWLLAAKGVMLDTEDLLEEIDDALSKSQVEAESHSAAKKVWNFLKSSFVSFFENEIESRMEKLIENLEDLATQSHVLGLKKADDIGVELGSGSKLRSTYLPKDSVIYGRDDDKEFVFNWLTSNTAKNLSVLSIVGMPGLGKTALAQHVFNDPRMSEAKFDIKIWVCVSDEFDVFNISRAILEGVTRSTDDSRDTEMVHRRLKEKLMGKKFLLVLDDVWNKNHSKWEEVQKVLVFGAQGSRILVTTRNKDVASTMRSEEYFPKLLQEDDCWKLFAKYAFRGDDTQPNPECRDIAMEIVKKCDGLPLALKTMGSLLYNKSSVSEWETVFRSEIWELPKDCCDIVPALALSYINLPSHLKACFAYFALFPKDYEFKKEHLMHLWMNKNLCCRQHSKTPEEVCQQYFNDLLSRSFIQQLGQEEEVFVMHDLLNDLAKYVAGDIYFRCEIGQIESVQKETRHFSVELEYDDQYFDGFGTLCNTERLRTFMPISRSRYSYPWHCGINTLIHELFSKFKFIRILSLSGCSDIKEIPDSIDNLKHLHSLDLSRTAIEKLTGKICLLSHLQILKLNNCKNLKELPSNLHLLTNLCRLEFISTTLTNVPLNLGKLKNLKVMMDSFNVGHGRELGIQRLGELNNIHEDLSIGGLQNIDNSLDALEADLKNKTHIVKLKLQWDLRRNGNSVDSKKEEDVIENLQPSKNLKELSILGYGGTQFPNWLQKNSLLNMEFLMLSGCKSCQHLPPLGLLPFLKHLHISQFDEIVTIDADFYGNSSSSFESLETLSFSYMAQWEKWACKVVIGAFPRLEHLSISFCPKLKRHLPEQLIPLKTLKIIQCQQLEASAPKALDLNLKNAGKVLFDWATVKKLALGGDNMEASFLDMVGHIIPDNSIEQLSIDSNTFSDCPKSDDSVSLWTFPLHFFPALKKLTLDGFSNLHMISHNHPHNHLQCLKIVRCHKFESLPGNMHMLFPSLEKLIICQCPRLESFPEGSLPSNLKHLSIIGCPAFESLPGNMHILLPSLNWLLIEECPRFKSFPEGFLPSNLEHLEIKECPEFESFPGNMHMLSLKSLRLQNCPRLVSFPDEGLPSSLEYLTISNCSKFESLPVKKYTSLKSIHIEDCPRFVVTL